MFVPSRALIFPTIQPEYLNTPSIPRFITSAMISEALACHLPEYLSINNPKNQPTNELKSIPSTHTGSPHA